MRRVDSIHHLAARERGGAGVLRGIKKRGGFGDLDELSIEQQPDAVGETFRLKNIVRDDNDGDAARFILFAHNIFNQRDIVRVEIRRRFIEQKDARLNHQRARERDALHFATR